LDAKRIWPEAVLVGVEKNKALFESVGCPGAELVCQDFLEWSSSEKSDLILGNPRISP
jgi:trans-aconitate methyltransferase